MRNDFIDYVGFFVLTMLAVAITLAVLVLAKVTYVYLFFGPLC